jgi:hypothetical protein
MNGRLPFLWFKSIRESQASARSAGEPSGWPQAEWEDAKFFRSSFVYGFKCEPSRRLNWGTLLGLALSVGISASFWSAAALLFARLSK